MNSRQRQDQHARRAAHGPQQRQRKEIALAESQEAAKKARKGIKGIVAQMDKRGYSLIGSAVNMVSSWKKNPAPSVPAGKKNRGGLSRREFRAQNRA